MFVCGELSLELELWIWSHELTQRQHSHSKEAVTDLCCYSQIPCQQYKYPSANHSPIPEEEIPIAHWPKYRK